MQHFGLLERAMSQLLQLPHQRLVLLEQSVAILHNLLILPIVLLHLGAAQLVKVKFFFLGGVRSIDLLLERISPRQ